MKKMLPLLFLSSFFIVIGISIFSDDHSKKVSHHPLFEKKIKTSVTKPNLYKTKRILDSNLVTLKKAPKNSRPINKKDPKWKEKTIKFFEGASDFNRNIEIEEIETNIISLGNKHIIFERVKIDFNQTNGNRGSFEGIINPQNGDIIVSYNHNFNPDLEKDINLEKYFPMKDRTVQKATQEELEDLKNRVLNNDFLDINKKLESFSKSPQEYKNYLNKQETDFKKLRSPAAQELLIKKLKALSP